jgi:hypothetical protein
VGELLKISLGDVYVEKPTLITRVGLLGRITQKSLDKILTVRLKYASALGVAGRDWLAQNSELGAPTTAYGGIRKVKQI